MGLSNLSSRSKIILTSATIFVTVAVVVLLIALTVGRQPASKKSYKVTPQDKRNLLVDQEERKRIIDDYNRRIGKQGNTKMLTKPKFKYELSPELKEKLNKLTTPTPKNVLGASTICNLDTVPELVYVYDLRGHWIVEEARDIAREYDVESIFYSLESETTTYEYLFIRPDNTASFTLYESSGVYTFNRASNLPAGNVDADNLKRYANQMLMAHKLDGNLSPPQYHTVGDTTYFTYRKNLLDFMLIDEASLQTFFDQENCSVKDSDIMGLISVDVKNNAEILKLLNNTRTSTKTYQLKTISLEQAKDEYQDAQPVDPIVFPANAEIDPNRSIVLGATLMAYYDVGLNFAQHLYVPLYIAHGFAKTITGQDVEVITFFPAVSAEEMLKKGLITETAEPGDRATQQQGTLPFATPTPHAPSKFRPKQSEFGTSGPGCPGNLVDYMVSCSVEGDIICRGSFTGSAANDPLNACKDGCSATKAIIDVTGGTNPCDAIMKQNDVTADKINGEVPRQRLAPAGEVSCVITVCPT